MENLLIESEPKQKRSSKAQYDVKPLVVGVHTVHRLFGGEVGLNSIRKWIRGYNTRHGVVQGKGALLIPFVECEKIADRIGREIVRIGDCIIEPAPCNAYNKEYIRAGVRYEKRNQKRLAKQAGDVYSLCKE